MNNTTIRNIRGALAASFLLVAGLAAANPKAEIAVPARPDTIAEIFTKGRVSFGERVRYESVNQSNRHDANAFTFRSALSFTTAPYQGFVASLELEDVAALGGSDYAVAPAFSTSAANRAVISDPVGTEVNQAWLAYKSGDTTLKGGRMNLVIDNARFIGNVGWRQNQQTYDAVTVQDKTVDKLTLTYGYLYHINRIFGNNVAGGDWESNSHVFNASYAGLPGGTVTGYAYLLDFKNAATQSCATYGISFAGAKTVARKTAITYRAEIATQSDYGSNTLNYSATYLLGEIGLNQEPFSVGLGFEKLGSDNGQGFRTPLATLHAFDGWADLFLATPADGLRDSYAKAGVTVVKNLALLGFYHKFDTDSGGTSLGREYDLQLSYKFDKRITGLVKYASFKHDVTTLPDVDKFWLQAEFVF